MTGHPEYPEPVVDNPQPLCTSFALEELPAVRRCTANHAQQWGLEGAALDGFVLAVNEVLSNAITHGGGQGQVQLWAEGQQVRCQVTDQGPGMTDPPSPFPPALSAPSGRGLWMAQQLCQVSIRTGPGGTVVNLAADLTVPHREPPSQPVRYLPCWTSGPPERPVPPGIVSPQQATRSPVSLSRQRLRPAQRPGAGHEAG
jgi:serine/threonine-protein kinase RsbW